MASNLFKSRFMVDNYGNESTTPYTDSNTVFIHTYLGDDSTGDGTRAKPYRSFSKANLKGLTYMVFRGVVNEYVYCYSKIIVGDDINQILITADYNPRFGGCWRNLTCDYFKYYGDTISVSFDKIVVNNSSTETNNNYEWKMNIFYKKGGSHYDGGAYAYTQYKNFTCNGLIFKNYLNYINHLIVSYFDFNYVSSPTTARFKFCVITTKTVLRLSGVNLVQPLYGNDSLANTVLARNVYLSATTMTQADGESVFWKDSFGNETFRVVNQIHDGGSSTNIFNGYADNLTGTLVGSITTNQSKTSIQLNVSNSSLFPISGDIWIPNISFNGFEVFTYTSVTINSPSLITFNGSSYTFKVDHSSGVTCTRYGDVLDFTLNSNPTNEALWAGDTGGYVGCFRPAENSIINSGITIIDVDSGGTDTINAGDLMMIDSSNNLIFNSSSLQTWNRYKDSSTTIIPNGSNFKGLNAMSQDGSPYGYYIGKYQNPIDSTIVNTGDTLSSGTWYKVFNDVSKDVTKSVLYNNIQYLPSYTFLCNSGITGFTLLNSDSGSYVRKINCDILESIEILPYDNVSTPSSFPKFSSPLMGECKLLFYTSAGATRYGKISGNPVLFIDLSGTNFQTDFPNTRDKISYYDNYAISNADQEFFTLSNPSLSSPRSTYFTVSIPSIKYLRREINGHYDEKYNY